MVAGTRVKICGLKTPQTVAAAVDAGAAYLGFNFFGKSPRSVTVAEAAELAVEVPPGIAKVALVVDEPDDVIDEIIARVPIDILQLHGSESVDRVRDLQARHGLPVMKVVGLAGAEDVEKLDLYGPVADMLLVDAKAPKGAVLPGGNGIAFDWRLIANRRWPVPWMLAGGLTPGNVAEAISLTGAQQVDVSSGVESGPGVKDPERIKAFLSAAGGTAVV